jgi:hypothetical protein
LDALTQEDDAEPFAPTGRLAGAEHRIGCFDGPDDLSTEDAHLDGYGT